MRRSRQRAELYRTTTNNSSSSTLNNQQYRTYDLEFWIEEDVVFERVSSDGHADTKFAQGPFEYFTPIKYHKPT